MSTNAGQPIASSMLTELEPINRILARDISYRQIEVWQLSKQDGDENLSALSWRQDRHWHSPDPLLLPLAGAVGD